ncbi:MAG: ABC transporter permease, partial [Bacilli bacterium]
MKIWTIAFYELKRLMKMRSVMLLLFVTPLVLIFILGSALSGQFEIKDKEIEAVKVAIFQESEGQITDGFHTFLQSEEIAPYILPVKMNSEQEVRDEVKQRKADIGLIVPKGFDQSILQGNNTEWKFILGHNQSKNLIGRMMLESYVDETNRMQAAIMTLGPTVATAMTPVEGSDKSASTEYVEKGNLNRTNKEYSAIQYYSATMMIMFLLFSGLTAATSLVNEKENHTLTRLQSMPITTGQIMLAKLLGNGILAGIQVSVIIVFTWLVYGVQWGESYVHLVLVCIFAIVASMGLAFIVALIAKSTRALGGAFSGFIGIMTFISGGMSPINGGFLEILQKFTLNYWASHSIIELMFGGDLTVVLQNIGILGSIGVGLLM